MNKRLPWLAAAAGLAWTGTQFKRWRETRTAELQQNGTVVETAVGPIEYARQGEGPTLLICHGGPGGYDQIETMADLVDAGFCVLAPSRPGYLGTPLTAGPAVAQQADAMIALLDALDMKQAAVLGVSAGGPIALELALRYPDRLWGLVMLAAVALPYRPNEETADSLLGRLFLTDSFLWLLDLGTWLFEQFSLRFPLASAKMMIQTESDLTAAQLQAHLDYMKQNPDLIAWYKALIRTTGPMSLRKAGLDNDLRQLAALPRLPLERMALPALALHGLADADVPYRHAQFIGETIPEAQLITLPNAGHLIWLSPEWPAAQQQLIQFLRQYAPTKGS